MRRKVMLISFLVAVVAASPGAATDRLDIIERRDAPLATTYFFPGKVQHVRSKLESWKVYPYVVKPDSGGAYLRLKLDADGGIWYDVPEPRAIVFTVDGQQFPVRIVQGDGSVRRYGGALAMDLGGPDVDPVVRRVSAGREVWMVCSYYGSEYRSNVRLADKQLATFRLIIEKLDSLR